MRKALSLSCLLLAGLAPGAAPVASCNTTSSFTHWFYAQDLPYVTPSCLVPGKRYLIGGSCVQDNFAYMIDVLGNTSPMWLPEDCNGTTGFTVSTSPLAGPTIHIYMTPSCTGNSSGANPYQAKYLVYRICGR